VNAIIAETQRVRLDPGAPTPRAGPGEAIVRPLWMGVSAFDSAIAHTPALLRDAAPLILGHEFVGKVESVSPAESDPDPAAIRARWVGARVVASPIISCAACDLCRAGLASHCRNRRVLGVHGWGGCFAQRLAVPVRNLVPVPATLDVQLAALAAPLGAAIHAAQIARVEGKTYITILGDSPDALLAAQVMARLNASVRLLGTRPERYGLCERWGIKHRAQSEVGRRADQDVVVDCTASAAGVSLAMELVRPRGKVVLLSPLGLAGDSGAHAAGHSLAEPILASIIEHELQVLGARGGSLADALTLLARGEIDVLPLITARKRLSDGPAALLLANDPAQIKVLLEAA